jgi:hypothetical protein
VLGWSVAWPDEHGVVASLASWSGQYFEQGERICAMWLLTRSAVVSDMWEATEVGQDVFTRRASGSG